MNTKNKIYLGFVVTTAIGFVLYANWSYGPLFTYDWYRDLIRVIAWLSVVWLLAAPVRLKYKIALLVFVPVAIYVVATFCLNNYGGIAMW